MTNDWIRGLVSWLATYALHSTLFLAGVWALCALRPPRALRNRERLWKLAVVGGVLTASLQLALGMRPLLGRIDWATDVAAAPAAPEPTPEPATEARPERSAPVAPAVARVDETRAPGAFRPPAESLRPERARRPERDAHRTEAQESTVSLGPVRQTPAEAPPAADETPPDPAELALLRTEDPVEDDAARPRADDGPEPLGAVNTDSRLVSRVFARAGAWPGFVLAGWITLGLMGFLSIVASWTLLRRSLLGRRALHEGPLVDELAELCRRARVSSRVRLSVSKRIASPLSTGVLFPEICLPEGVLTELTREQQSALLAHELAHTVRRDPLWFAVYSLLERVLFFQPLNRVARRELSELAEIACDDWAVRWTGARLALASCLTHVAGWILGERERVLAQPGLAGHRSRLGRRIERLLDDRRSPNAEPRAPWWPPLAATALAAVALAVPGVSAVRARPAAPAQDDLPPPRHSTSEPLPVLPMSEPAPAPAERLPPAERLSEERADDVEGDRTLLEGELALLQAEIGALRAELERRELSQRFAPALQEIDRRMVELREQHRRVRALLELLPQTNTTPAPEGR